MTEPTEPTEPTLSADPTDPMLNTDPWEATLNRDPSDHRDHFDSTTAHLRSKRTTIRRAGTPIIATDLARFLRGSTSGRLTTGSGTALDPDGTGWSCQGDYPAGGRA